MVLSSSVFQARETGGKDMLALRVKEGAGWEMMRNKP